MALEHFGVISSPPSALSQYYPRPPAGQSRRSAARSKVLGTNPLTIAAPTPDPRPLTADMATSTGATGKIMAAKNEGTEILLAWAVDSAGMPTNDPVAAMAGALMPFGGNKGSAVLVLLEAVVGSPGAEAYAHEAEDLWCNPACSMNTGHLLIAFDSGAFTGHEHTEERVARECAAVRSSGRDGAPVLAPGDPEYREEEKKNREAVTLSAATSRSLQQLGERLGFRRSRLLNKHQDAQQSTSDVPFYSLM